MISRFLALTLVAFLILSAQPVLADGIPSGSYQQSCKNIRVDGDTLTADCSADGGGRVTSSVSVRCRGGDIGNVNGTLRCNGGDSSGGLHLDLHLNAPLPSGSYQQSCTNAHMNGTTLSATCSADNGARVNSSLNIVECRHGADIGDRNGNLGCDRR
jgi:hypothetical protein